METPRRAEKSTRQSTGSAPKRDVVVGLTRESSEDEAAQPAAAAADRVGAVDDASDGTPKAKRTLSASADDARDVQADTPRAKQARVEGVAAAMARTEHAATVAETGAMDASCPVADGDELSDEDTRSGADDASSVSIFQASDSTTATSVMIRAQLEFTGPSAMVWDQLPAVFVLRPEVGEMFVGSDCRGGLILNSSEQPNMISRQHAMLCWNESDGLWTVHRQLFLTGRVI